MFKQLLGLFGKRPSSEAHSEPDKAARAHYIEEAIASLRETMRAVVVLDVQVGVPVPEDPVSSVSGRPSLPPGMPWPCAPNGKPLGFLAQINYAEMPGLPGYPEQGLLVVFGSEDWEDGLKPTPFAAAVHYFEETTGLERREPPEASRMGVFGERLLAEGAPLVGRLSDMPLTGTHGEFERHLMVLDETWEEEREAVWLWADEAKPGVLYYGGYPDFTQYDFRDDEDAPQVSEVLLQMGFFKAEDTEVLKGFKWQISWGDAGEASIMVTPEDLAARRFEGAVFYWDCC